MKTFKEELAEQVAESMAFPHPEDGAWERAEDCLEHLYYVQSDKPPEAFRRLVLAVYHTAEILGYDTQTLDTTR